jgi:hypothetical protein
MRNYRLVSYFKILLTNIHCFNLLFHSFVTICYYFYREQFVIIYFENEIEEEEMNDVLIRRSNVCSLTWGGTIRAHLSRGSSFHPGHENYLR